MFQLGIIVKKMAKNAKKNAQAFNLDAFFFRRKNASL